MPEFPPAEVAFHRYYSIDMAISYWEVHFTIEGNSFPNRPRPFKATFKEIYTYAKDIVTEYKLTVAKAEVYSWRGYFISDGGYLIGRDTVISNFNDDAEMAMLILQLT
jgi:hypothetical protein